MNVLIYEPATFWGKRFVNNLKIVSGDESPYTIVSPGTNQYVNLIVIDLNHHSIETAKVVLEELRKTFPYAGIVCICEDAKIEPIADSLGITNAYSAFIRHTDIRPRYTHNWLQLAQVTIREHNKLYGHRT